MEPGLDGSGKEPVKGEPTTDAATVDLELAGVIHDVNQMLAVVVGRAGLLLHRGQSDDTSVHLRAMELAAQDAAAMLARMGSPANGRPADGADEAPLRQSVDQAALLITPPAGAVWDTADWRFDNAVPADLAAGVPAQVVREVISNLLLNSLQASPQGVGVRICAEVREDCVVLTVADDGPGVPRDARKTLFQAGVSSSGAPGRGVGLAGCRALARSWNGDLKLADSQVAGAVFELELPLARSTSPNSASDDGSGPAPRAGRSVLVVDDEKTVREMLGAVMTELGCQVTLARDAGEALKIFAPDRFDLVFLDQTLPGTQGDELAARLRDQDSSVAIALVTGWGQEKILAELDPKHVDLKAVKPLDMSKMVELLARGSALVDGRRAGALKDEAADSHSGRDQER